MRKITFILAISILIMMLAPMMNASAAQNNPMALSSQGANYYGIIPFDESRKLTEELTLQVSVYYTNWQSLADSNIDRTIISNTQSGGFRLAINYVNNRYAVFLAYRTAGQYRYVETNIRNLSSGWHTFTVTYDANDGMKLYVDGVKVNENNFTSYTPIFYTYDLPIFLGAEVNAAGNIDSQYPSYCRCIMDEFRIYDRALSDIEVEDTWNYVIPSDTPGLIGHYTMDDGTLYDHSPSAIHGDINTLQPTTNTHNLLSDDEEEPITPPDGLTATTVSDAVYLSWDAVDGADGYHVYRDSVQITSTPISFTEYTDTDLQPSTTYTYNVSTVVDGDESMLSSPVEITTDSSLPPPAPQLIATPGKGKVTLHWSDVGADHYIIYRDSVQIDTTTSRTYIDEDVTNETEYIYTVVAVNQYGQSPESVPAAATPSESIIETDWGMTAKDIFVTVMFIIGTFSSFIVLSLAVRFAPRIIRTIYTAINRR